MTEVKGNIKAHAVEMFAGEQAELICAHEGAAALHAALLIVVKAVQEDGKEITVAREGNNHIELRCGDRTVWVEHPPGLDRVRIILSEAVTWKPESVAPRLLYEEAGELAGKIGVYLAAK